MKYTMRLWKLIAAFVALIIAGCASIKIVRVINSGSAMISEEDEVIFHFEQEGHLIIIPVAINGIEGYRFIVDSGALTVIDTEIAEELGLEKQADIAALDTGGGTNQVELTQIESFRIGEMEIKDAGATVFDLSKVSEKMSEEIDGILGSNILRFFRVTIDYSAQTITFSQNFNDPVSGDNLIALPFIQNMMTGFAPGMTCLINDEVALNGIVDTGAVGYVSLPRTMVEDLYSNDNESLIESIGVMGGGALTDSEKMYLVKLDQFRIGELALGEIPAATSEIEFALIGYDLLKHYLITIDYPNNLLYLKPFGEPDFSDGMISIGMGILFNAEGKAYVCGYWEGSAAESAGIRTNDFILSVDGIPVTNYSVLQLTGIMKQTTNPVSVTVSNHDGIRELNITAKSLL